MAEDFTHQFLDQAFSVGQQVQLQCWQLFSEIRALHEDFFHILRPYHIQKQLKRHSRKFWISLQVSKLGDLGESTVIHVGFRVSCWFKLKIFCLFSNKLSCKAVIAQMFLPGVRNNSLSSSMSWQSPDLCCMWSTLSCMQRAALLWDL